MKGPWPKSLVGNAPATDGPEQQWSPAAQRRFRYRLARWCLKAAFWILPEPDLEYTVRSTNRTS